MKILHLISDHQVIERTLGVYEKVFPGCNEILVFNAQGKPFKRLKGDYEGRVVDKNNLSSLARSYDYSNITHIIAHYMSMDKIDFIKFVPRHIHVSWELYGYDLYNQFLYPMGLKIYSEETYKYTKYPFIYHYFEPLFNLLLTIKGAKYRFKWQKKQQFKYITKRVDSLQYCCKYDAKYVEDFACRSIPSYEIFNYSLDEVLGDLEGHSFYTGKDILVGNSASLSNNHLYVINFLKNIKLSEGSQIIVPLSYGGTEKYAKKVASEYLKAFPKRVEILKEYMPLHEYNKMFLTLKAVILSAWRQESQGTAIMAFYLGIKVFMSERSPLYKWFVDCGFIVFTIENITTESIEQQLSYDEKEHNRQLVVERYSPDVIEQTLKKNIK